MVETPVRGCSLGDRAADHPPSRWIPVFQPPALDAEGIDKLHGDKSRASQQKPGARKRRMSIFVVVREGAVWLDV